VQWTVRATGPATASISCTCNATRVAARHLMMQVETGGGEDEPANKQCAIGGPLLKVSVIDEKM
jgi:hypothetical protein